MYKIKTISYDTRRSTFWTLIFISALSLVLYIYGVSATVRNTVARQNLESAVAGINTRIGEMEFTYIGLKNAVSLETAYARGFQNVTEPVYISRSASRSLSMNTRRVNQ